MKFEGFARVWTPVAFSHEVKKKPLRVKIAGEPILLFRDARKTLSALIDRCPHRGVALSLGQVTESGCIRCPFHGWEFDQSGKCVTMPFNDLPAEKRARYRTPALAVREIAGLVWLWTGPAEEVEGEPELAETLTSPQWTHSFISEVWNIHWTRAMENMLDSPHVPVLHRRTIGRGLSRYVESGKVMEVQVTETPFGMRTQAEIIEREPSGAWLEWRRPNGMRLNIPMGPTRAMQMHIWCVPIDDGHVRMMLLAGRNFALWNPLVSWMNQVNRYVLYEDRAVVESSDPPEVPEPGREMSVGSDRATLYFRRYYLRHLKPSRIDAGTPADEAASRPLPADAFSA